MNRTGSHSRHLHGAIGVPFVELIRDTIATHGLPWAVDYYTARLPRWEARFWLRLAYL